MAAAVVGTLHLGTDLAVLVLTAVMLMLLTWLASPGRTLRHDGGDQVFSCYDESLSSFGVVHVRAHHP